MSKSKFFTNDDCGCAVKPQGKVFEEGGNIDGEESLQIRYIPASNACTTLDVVVPKNMADGQNSFNKGLRAVIEKMGFTVDEYVAKKLHYNSVEEMCFQDELDSSGNKQSRLAAEQIDAIATAIWNHETGGNSIILADQTGSGKGRSQPITAKILTPNGFVKMGDLKVGDSVVSVDGLATKVLGIFPQGKIDVYEVEFSDGSKTQCSADHLWSVINKQRKHRLGKNGSFTWNDCLVSQTKDIEIKKSVEVPLISSPVIFKKQMLPVHPYVLGALLGNGSIRKRSIQIISPDEETLVRFSENIDKTLFLRKSSEYHYYVVKKTGRKQSNEESGQENKLLTGLKLIGLENKKSWNKFIPECYKINSVENRVELLRGLMDTDGWCEKDGALYYSSASENLIKDLQFVVQSLGGTGIIRTKQPKGKNTKGEPYRLSYILSIKLPNTIRPFYVKRKLERVRDFTKYFPQRIIRKITPIGKKECQCIKVEHPSSLYITDNFIVTHNTCAGLIRYAILELKKQPYFFTEKKTLINDIYRDMVAIGFDAGVPEFVKKETTEKKEEYTEAEVVKIIKKDIEDNEDISIDFELPSWCKPEYLLAAIKRTSKEGVRVEDEDGNTTTIPYEQVDEVLDEVIEAYTQHLIENGVESYEYVPNPKYEELSAAAIRKGRFFVRPFCPNAIDVKDTKGNILYPKTTEKEFAEIYRLKEISKNKYQNDPDVDVSKFELPKKYSCICVTYTQLQGIKDRRGVMYNKIKFLKALAKDNVLILDESHNSSGVNNDGQLTNRGESIFPMVRASAMTTYVSATYAKRANNMPLYSLRTSVRETGLSDSELINVFTSGGNALQEAVSAELARNGQLLRREKLIQVQAKYYEEGEGTNIGDNQINKLNRVADVFEKVLDFQSKVHSLISQAKKYIPVAEDEEIKKARSVNALSFQLFNFMLLGLKINQTSEKAIEEINAGRKVVVAIANTMESALNSLSKTFLTENEDDLYKVGDQIKNDFSLYLAYMLNYTMRFSLAKKEVDEKGNEVVTKRTIKALSGKDEMSELIREKLFSEYSKLLEEILSFDTGIPIAPIDMIKRNIEKNGNTIEEVTGRQRVISFGENTELGTVEKRKIRPTEEVVRNFNENEIDCLIINQSGATGLSMHALPNDKATIVYPPTVDENGVETENAPTSLKNKKEVKARAMVITQMELDVNKEMQKLGRISRTGQVYLPHYTYVISAIPSESRLAALMEKKIRSLSANTSASQTQNENLVSFDDFFSNDAVIPFNETLEEIGMRGTRASSGAEIQDFTKQLYFKDYKLQKDFYETFSRKLALHIADLKSKGLYTGEMSYKNYAAETKIKHPFFIGNNESKTSFGRHSFIEQSKIKLFKERNTERKITEHINDLLKIGSGEGAKFVSSIDKFKTEAANTLARFVKEKTSSTEGRIKNERDDIKDEEETNDIAKKEIEKFTGLSTALALEEELKKVKTENQDATKQMTEFAMSGKMEELQKITPKITELANKTKILEEQLKQYEEVLSKRSEFNSFARQLKRAQDKKDDFLKRIARLEKELNEYKTNAAVFMNYISQIGSVVEYIMYNEQIVKIDKEDDYPSKNIEDIERVEYDEVYRREGVLVGVHIPNSYDELTAGRCEIVISTVTSKETTNLYRLFKYYSVEETQKGFRDLEEIKITNKNYKGYWDTVAGKFDNSYSENRFFIVGSLLKTYSLAAESGYSGQIVKYNTIDNKIRIGIEVADNKEERTDKTVYKVLEERYGENANLQYPIYFAGNEQNINTFISKYIYWFMFGNVIDAIKNGKTLDDTGGISRMNENRFIFQVSLKNRFFAVKISIPSEVTQLSGDLVGYFNAGDYADCKRIIEQNKGAEYLFDENKLMQLVNIVLLFGDVKAGDAFARSYNKVTKQEISSENYFVYNGKKTQHPVSVSTYTNKIRISRGEQFKTFLPTNLTTMASLINNGEICEAELKTDWYNFSLWLNGLRKQNTWFTFATTSVYFEKVKDMFILEQFEDSGELEKPEVNGKVGVGIEANIDAMIDELYTELLNA